MLREHLFDKRAPADSMFRWRGGDISRLEGLSDGAFAVTITLLVVSLDVPQTFYDLWGTVRDLPAFLANFAMLMLAWRYHYLLFRRYGLEDFLTLVLNGSFLFLLMFYAYPLKFLTTFLWRLVLGESADSMFAIPEGQAGRADPEAPDGGGLAASRRRFRVAAMLSYGASWLLIPELRSDPTRSLPPSAQAGWARSIVRRTRGSTVK